MEEVQIAVGEYPAHITSTAKSQRTVNKLNRKDLLCLVESGNLQCTFLYSDSISTAPEIRNGSVLYVHVIFHEGQSGLLSCANAKTKVSLCFLCLIFKECIFIFFSQLNSWQTNTTVSQLVLSRWSSSEAVCCPLICFYLLFLIFFFALKSVLFFILYFIYCFLKNKTNYACFCRCRCDLKIFIWMHAPHHPSVLTHPVTLCQSCQKCWLILNIFILFLVFFCFLWRTATSPQSKGFMVLHTPDVSSNSTHNVCVCVWH